MDSGNSFRTKSGNFRRSPRRPASASTRRIMSLSAAAKQPTPSTLALHRAAILIDTHVDTIQRAVDLGHDLVRANSSGFMDLERMKAGNMTAAFFAVCVDYNNIRRGTGGQRQDTLLHAVLQLCRENPDKI